MNGKTIYKTVTWNKTKNIYNLLKKYKNKEISTKEFMDNVEELANNGEFSIQ